MHQKWSCSSCSASIVLCTHQDCLANLCPDVMYVAVELLCMPMQMCQAFVDKARNSICMNAISRGMLHCTCRPHRLGMFSCMGQT